MKYFLTYPLLALFMLCIFSATAQSDLKKADKQYELAAYNLAIKSYLKVLDKDAQNGPAMAKMADSYRHLNRMEEAATWYRNAIKQTGMDPIHIFEFANVLKALGDYSRAAEWFEIYAEKRPVAGRHFVESCNFAKSIKDVPSLYKISNEFANSPQSDFGAAFYNNQVVFTSARQDIPRNEKPREHNWTGVAKNQLFISSIDQNGFLGRPAYLRSDLKSNYNEGPVSYSGNGRVVAFTKNNFVNGTRQIPGSGMELSIYLADVTSEGDWGEAKPFPFNGSGYSSGFPFLSNDGNTLYFASNRPDGFGGYDIYISYRTGSSWSTPENMGPVINSAGDEITPAMIGEDLFFASNWHHGLGGFDIFRGERSEGIWKNVYHLGNGINSSYDDYGYTYNSQSNRGYIVSNRKGGKGSEDLYRVIRSTENMLIAVADKTTGKPIANALIDFTACGEPVFKTNKRGEYRFQAMEGLNCQIVVSKEGYRSYTFDLNAQTEAAESFEILLTSQKAESDYLGKIINANDNKSIAAVRVKATDQTSGLVIETTSDNKGDYHLPLDPGREYLIRFSKAGFLDTHKKVNTGSGQDKSILGVLPLPLSGTSAADSNSRIVSSNTPGRVVNEAEPPVEIVEVVTSTTTVKIPAPAPEPVDEMAIEAQEGFSVQLSAVPQGQSVNVNEYLQMNQSGNIYGKNEGNYKKVRVGIFATRAEAKAAQAAARMKGFKSAFIVEERIVSLREMEIYSEAVYDRPATPVVDNTPPPPPSIRKPTPENRQSDIKVQIASYKNMNYFKPQSVSDIGTIETRKKGDFTIILLSGFADKKAALQARNAAVQKGYKGAYLVKDQAGKLEKVE